MTEASWDDFIATTEAEGVVPAIIDAIADVIEPADPDASAIESTDDVGDLATAEMDAEVSMAADLVEDGDFAGAYDALGAAQGFNDVAADAYGADY